MLWELRCVEDLHEVNALTGEPLELVRLDQCAYGLQDKWGYPHFKPTGMLLSSACMKSLLQQRCPGDHEHSLVQGSATKKAQQWPESLCKAILRGASQELSHQIVYTAYAGELFQEESSEMPAVDGIYDARDLAPPDAKRRRVDFDELNTEEDLESIPVVEDLLHQVEQQRRVEWRRIDKAKRLSIRRLHNQLGHCSNATLQRMLRSSLASPDVIRAAGHFRCQVCEQLKREKEPSSTRPTPEALNFNEELTCDVFEVKDASGQRHSIMSLVDLATHYHVAGRVSAGGMPPSHACAQVLNDSWLSWAGPPKRWTSDQGVHNKGKVRALLMSHGVEIRQAAARAPWQIGTTERHGGLLKEIMLKSIQSKQLSGSDAIAALCAEATRAKNTLINKGGYSPAQWVLGHQPVDLTSLASEDPNLNLGIHQSLLEAEDKAPQERYMLQLLLRQVAKESFVQCDTSQRLRRALLRKATPLRGPYSPGDMICFNRNNRWYGPARVLGKEGRSSLWIIHGGVTFLVAEVSVRPASAQELYKKHLLEMKPSRKRERQLLQDDDDVEVDDIPFTDDLDQSRSLRQRRDGGVQAPFVDVQIEAPSTSSASMPTALPMETSPEVVSEQQDDGGTTTIPSSSQDAPNQQQELEQQQMDTLPASEAPSGLPNLVQEPSPPASQPDAEISPGISRQVSTAGDSVPLTEPSIPNELTQALRRDVGQLDGLPRGHLAEADYIPVEQQYITYDDLYAFLGSRTETNVQKRAVKYRRKNVKKVGAGREIDYGKVDDSIQEKLNATRRKEWSNWVKYTDGKWITRAQMEQMVRDEGAEVIPTRWVDVDKAEIGEPEKLKSRLVVRGDLEDASKMRTDSPTASAEMLNLVIALSACRDTPLKSGDISAAFLQGSKLDRVLILSMPKTGIPDPDSDGFLPEDRFYLVSSTAYGTKDAPRGWFKNLHATLVKEGLVPVPHECGAYVMRNEVAGGPIRGLCVVHVDDLLWTGSKDIESLMDRVSARYKFGSESTDKFKYCGREIVKDEKGIHVTCPGLADRVRPIYLTAQQRKARDQPVSEEVRGQLRSVIGSLAWFQRVCRPDLAYAVNRLQSAVSSAVYDDVIFANGIVKITKETKNEGITFPLKAFKFEDLMIVGIQDASFAADNDLSGSGKRLGGRSQSGRLTCLADKSFMERRTGHLLPINWHSTTLKRVCRSTLQAETLSLQLGSDETEHLRSVIHGLYYDHDPRNRDEWQVASQDSISTLWLTDCRSLHDYVVHQGMSQVSDKRLALDLSALRQMTWRQSGELTGDPLLTDRIPSDATTRLHWLPTKKMAADCLTKSMKPGVMLNLMRGLELDCTEERDDADNKKESEELKKELLGLAALGRPRYNGFEKYVTIREKNAYKRRPFEMSLEAVTEE